MIDLGKIQAAFKGFGGMEKRRLLALVLAFSG
jgi:hypothetical protein